MLAVSYPIQPLLPKPSTLGNDFDEWSIAAKQFTDEIAPRSIEIELFADTLF